MISNYNFVITSAEHWDALPQSNIRHIATEIAKHNNVVYINPPLHLGEAFKEFIGMTPQRKASMKSCCAHGKNVTKIDKSLWVVELPPINLPVEKIGSPDIFDYLNKLNNKLFSSSVLSAVEGIGLGRFIHINDNDLFSGSHLREYLKPQLEIFYKHKNTKVKRELSKHFMEMEQKLVEESDLVLTTTNYLNEGVLETNKHSYVVGQGVDLKSFQADKKHATPEPLKEVKQLKKPIIGFIGTLCPLRVRTDYLFQIAKQRPDYSLVIIGSEDKYMAENMLNEMPNVFILPAKQSEELAPYIATFDVCIDPLNTTEKNAWKYPIKEVEFLAMGKPVVATVTPPMEVLGDWIRTTGDRATFIELIDEAVKAPKEEELRLQRIAYAHTHSWSVSVGKMYDRISECILAGVDE